MTNEEYLFEEHFHAKGKRESRKERKRLQMQDRSKFKKTDKEKRKTESFSEDLDLLTGKVLSISREKIHVDHEGTELLCSLKGKLQKEHSLDKNILAVGDIVHFTKQKVIVQISPRFSILAREELLRKKQQILAVNIDQVLICVSVVQPQLKPSLVDRYIIAAEKGNIKPVIVINKIDLFESTEFSQEKIAKEKKRYDEFLSAYEMAGYTIVSISTKTNAGLSSLLNLLNGKASVLSGQSGVGKSSIINMITGKNLKTGKVVKKTYKGAHVTSKAELIHLASGGFCIDTPGIKSFGVWKLEKETIVSHFPEIVAYQEKCRFRSCSHLTEPGCAVQQALQEKRISSLRFESYRSLMEESDKENLNR